MASIIPVFEQQFQASGLTSTKDDWVAISNAIPTGTQLWLGFGTFISEDKSLIFEIRANLPTKNAGNSTDTQLRGFTSVPTGESKDVDFYLGGAIQWLAPVSAQSTGVEKLWLRIRSGTMTVGVWDYIIYYTSY